MGGWTAAALYWLVWCGVAVALVDLAVHRIPDLLSLPAFAGTVVLLGGAACSGESGSPLRAAAAAVALMGLFGIAVLGRMGLGDVKLAPTVGAVMGWYGWPVVVLGTLAAFVLAIAFALVSMVRGRWAPKAGLPLGPFMICGALGACLLKVW
ncbi:prepilin peptidase [Embleya sp. MST-111070]|uniref:prepilin peptidase n=1 Tax=Embleya sp. MST-111070 TaxID=3398231 RepID=UPI003F73722E